MPPPFQLPSFVTAAARPRGVLGHREGGGGVEGFELGSHRCLRNRVCWHDRLPYHHRNKRPRDHPEEECEPTRRKHAVGNEGENELLPDVPHYQADEDKALQAK